MSPTRAKIVISVLVSSLVLLGVGIALKHDPKPISRIATVYSSSSVPGKSWADLGAAELATLPAGTEIVNCTPTQNRLQPGVISERALGSPQLDPGFHFLLDGRCAFDPSALPKPMRVDWLEGIQPLQPAWWWTPISAVHLSTLPTGTQIVNCWGKIKRLPSGVRLQVGMNFAKDYPDFHFLSDGRCAFFPNSTSAPKEMAPKAYDLQWFGTGLAGTPRVGSSSCFSGGDPQNNHCGIETNMSTEMMPAGAVVAPTLQFNPKITITPSSNLHDGDRVIVKVVGASPGERFGISECGSAADANVNGCGDQPALQPFIDTDPSGAGSITFHVKVNASMKPNNTSVFQSCKDQCVIMAHGVDINGRSTVVFTPLKFARYNTLVPWVPVHTPALETRSGGPIVGILPSGHGWALTTAGLEFTTNKGSSVAPFSFIPYPISASNIDDVVVKGPHVMLAGVINFLPVLKSSNDIGATWKTVTLPAGSGNAGFARFVRQDGALIGMLVTDLTSSNFSSAEWYATPDAGVTWTHHSIPSGGVVTAAGGDLWLAGGPQLASLYKSSDHGVTWSKIAPPTAAIKSGAAFSIPGQLKNGNVILVATTPNVGPSAIFRVNVYVSSDLGAWKVLARTSLIGQIESGIGVAASVIANSVWLGGTTDQGIAVISDIGKITKTSSMKAVDPGGSIYSIIPYGNSSAWVTTVNGICPSGKSSCKEVSALIGTVNSGKTWSPVGLIEMPTS